MNTAKSIFVLSIAILLNGCSSNVSKTDASPSISIQTPIAGSEKLTFIKSSTSEKCDFRSADIKIDCYSSGNINVVDVRYLNLGGPSNPAEDITAALRHKLHNENTPDLINKIITEKELLPQKNGFYFNFENGGQTCHIQSFSAWDQELKLRLLGVVLVYECPEKDQSMLNLYIIKQLAALELYNKNIDKETVKK
ncbi:hypothetical protein [Stutzerimonas stutzeri]|uniref:hypothetical protein n=1 Tax=Stutzerimonas stutzeri TaxID=316 RepID=UPI0011AF69DE|nr:hypothetical protein [Stutzerimonas stutzeri]MCQ4264862.1 hypothetical protein [Stutzerimonas stutzeri]